MSSISFQVPEPGIWTVTGEFGGQIVTQRINITDKGSSTPVALTFRSSIITVTSPVGTSLLLTDGTNQLTAISTGTNVFTIYNMGQWTVSGTLEGYTLNSVTVIVAAGQNYPVELEIKSATLTVTAPVGMLVSVVGGGDTQEITATNGTAVFQITTLGSYQVSGTLNGLTSNTVTVDVTAYQNYTATLTIEAASIVVTTLDDVLVTAQNGNITLSDTAVNGQVTFQTQTFGTWTVTGTLTGYTFSPQTVDVQAYQQYDVSLQPLVATITVTAPNGTEIVAENSTGEQVQGFAGQGTTVLDIYSLDTWTVSGTQNGLVTNSVPVQVADWTNYPVNLTIWAATITVTTPTGTLVTAQNGDTQIQATASNDQVIFAVQITGNWTVSAQFDTQSDSEVVDVQAETDYPVRLWVPTIVPTVATGSVVTCTQGQTVLTKTSQNGKVKFYVPTLGEWTLNATLSQQSSNTVIVDVQEDRDYPLLLNYTFATITVATVAGTEVTAQNGAIIITQTADSNGGAVFEVATFGTWTMSASFDGELVSAEVVVSEAINYDVEIMPPSTPPNYGGPIDQLFVARSGPINGTNASNNQYIIFAGGNSGSTYYNTVDAYKSDLTHSTADPLSAKNLGISSASTGEFVIVKLFSYCDVYSEGLVKTSAQAVSPGRSSSGSGEIGEYALFAGGYNGGTYYSDVKTYNGQLTQASVQSLPLGISAPACGSTNEVLILGGGGTKTGQYSSVYAYNLQLTLNVANDLPFSNVGTKCASTPNHIIFMGVPGAYSPATFVAYNNNLVQTQLLNYSSGLTNSNGTTVNEYAIFGGGYINPSYMADVFCFDDNLTRTALTNLSLPRGNVFAGSLNGHAVFAGGTITGGSSDVADSYFSG